MGLAGILKLNKLDVGTKGPVGRAGRLGAVSKVPARAGKLCVRAPHLVAQGQRGPLGEMQRHPGPEDVPAGRRCEEGAKCPIFVLPA